MIPLTSEQWNVINEMIYAMNAETNIYKLRKDFLMAISALIPHDKSFFDLGYKKNTKVVFFDPVSTTIEDEYLVSYFQEYEAVDTMFWFFSQNQSDVYRETDYISEAMRNTSIFYSGWLAPQNILYSLGSRVAKGEMLYGSVNLWRSEIHGDFSDEEFQILSILNKHLSLRFFSQFPNGIRRNSENDYSGTICHLYHLTPRELELVHLIYEGLSIREISEKLYISENTVKKHTHNIFQKMKIQGRAQLVKIVHGHMTTAVDTLPEHL